MSNLQTLFDLIGELARRRHQAAERSFASLGLNHTEARLLAMLHKHKGVAAQDALSATLHVDRTNAGRALQSLQQRGYIIRTKDESDKRANFVRITDKGRETVGEIAKLRRQMAQNFFGGLRDDEAGAVIALLQKAIAD